MSSICFWFDCVWLWSNILKMDKFIIRSKKPSSKSNDSSSNIQAETNRTIETNITTEISSTTETSKTTNTHKNKTTNRTENITTESNNNGNPSTTEAGPSEDEASSQKKYKQKYKTSWEVHYSWLQCVNESCFCKICFKSLENNKKNLERHHVSERHVTKQKNESQMMSIPSLFQHANTCDSDISKIKAELMCVMFCIKRNLSISNMDALPSLISNVCPDSSIAKTIKCGRTKATSMINNIIGPFSQSLIVEHLKNNKFSIIIDETTDVSSTKCLVLVTRFFNIVTNKMTDHFFALLELQHSDSQEIFSSLKSIFEEKNIALTNIIGLATDNASVMSGNISGVKAKFLQINKNLFFLGCTCHSLHLCASAAFKKFPDYLEKIIKAIYNYFAHSPKRIGAYKQFQEAFDLKTNNILGLSATRWLSLESVINRLLEQWQGLQHYFNLEAFENQNSTVNISNFLMNSKNKLYLLFLSYILNLMNKSNKLFQSEFTQIHLLNQVMQDLFLEILKNFIRLDEINVDVNFEDSALYMPLSDIYFGIQLQQHINKNLNEFAEDELFDIKNNLLEFYKELCNQIKKRFNFNNKKLQLLKYLDVSQIANGSLMSILPIFEEFPHSSQNVEVLNMQWRFLLGNNDFINKYHDP
ncbi:zinc finger MYM-type protein 6-like isoform X2 [Episyrphus balteatus]|uniref:zinc finger MYM-type protein 6-like isoform X2 n=1 Tax=Episyrphus balteatus TaxID=286459 RepID=UPI0024858C97|nr:zinc finger MYM-type protein 6-like isoform X2 [Episyrphus balteatus]